MTNITYKGKDGVESYTIDTETLIPAAIEYLLRNGLTSSLDDAVAGLKASLTETHGDAAKWTALAKVHGFADHLTPDQAYPYVAKDKQAAKFAAILDGTVSTRSGGPRLDPVERAMRDIAEGKIREKVKATPGVKMPTGEALTKLVAELVAKNEATFRKLAETQIKAQAKLEIEITL